MRRSVALLASAYRWLGSGTAERFHRTRAVRRVALDAGDAGVGTDERERVAVNEVREILERVLLPVAIGATADKATRVRIVVTARALLIEPEEAFFAAREQLRVRMRVARLALELRVSPDQLEVDVTVIEFRHSCDAGQREGACVDELRGVSVVLLMAQRTARDVDVVARTVQTLALCKLPTDLDVARRACCCHRHRARAVTDTAPLLASQL